MKCVQGRTLGEIEDFAPPLPPPFLSFLAITPVWNLIETWINERRKDVDLDVDLDIEMDVDLDVELDVDPNQRPILRPWM